MSWHSTSSRMPSEVKAMRSFIFAVATLAGLAGTSSGAHAIGCLSGGAAGALAGHMAGHGVLGAVGGCIAGHAWHKHQQHMKQDAYMNQQSYDQDRKSVD